MTSFYIPRHLRLWLESLGEHCEYCQTSASITGIQLVADHIIPRSRHGLTTESNLCRACSSCNTYKNEQVTGIDPLTESLVTLFNPRLQLWQSHFTWSDDGTTVIGLTPCGRATVAALKLNNLRIVASRRLWVSVGWHPPKG